MFYVVMITVELPVSVNVNGCYEVRKTEDYEKTSPFGNITLLDLHQA